MAGVSSQNFKQLPFNAVVSVFCVVWSDTGSEQVDEQTAQEETEDKLKLCIDNLTDKRWETVFFFNFLFFFLNHLRSVKKEKWACNGIINCKKKMAPTPFVVVFFLMS